MLSYLTTHESEAREVVGVPMLAWDGCGANGALLPAGTYFVRLVTDAAASVQKVVLTR